MGLVKIIKKIMQRGGQKAKPKRNDTMPQVVEGNAGRPPLEIIEATYNGQPRRFQVRRRVRGKAGDLQLLSWQESGGSVSGKPVPGYRRFRYDRLQNRKRIS